jgi:hypothetical protein
MWHNHQLLQMWFAQATFIGNIQTFAGTEHVQVFRLYFWGSQFIPTK